MTNAATMNIDISFEKLRAENIRLIQENKELKQKSIDDLIEHLRFKHTIKDALESLEYNNGN